MQFCDTIIQWKERFFLQNVSGGKDFTFYVSQNLQCLANSTYKFQMVSAILISIYTLSKLHLLFCLPALAKNIFKCPSLNHDHSFFYDKKIRTVEQTVFMFMLFWDIWLNITYSYSTFTCLLYISGKLVVFYNVHLTLNSMKSTCLCVTWMTIVSIVN